MIFKAIRPLIFSPLVLIVDGEEVDNVEVNDPAIDIYDYYEVIGVRAGVNYFDSWKDYEGRVIVSLKPTLTAYYEEPGTKEKRKAYESGITCEK